MDAATSLKASAIRCFFRLKQVPIRRLEATMAFRRAPWLLAAGLLAAITFAALPLNAAERPASGDLAPLLAEQRIALEARGDGLDSIRLRLRRSTAQPLTVRIPAGTVFGSESPGLSDLLVLRTSDVVLPSADWTEARIEVACLSLPREVPKSEDIFTLQPDAAAAFSAAFPKLLPTLEAAGAPRPTRQAAVWVAVENATFADLGVLIDLYANTRIISEHAAAEALRHCAAAGIEVTQKAIWEDRVRIFRPLHAGPARDWLLSQDPEIAGFLTEIDARMKQPLAELGARLAALRREPLSIALALEPDTSLADHAGWLKNFLSGQGHSVNFTTPFDEGEAADRSPIRIFSAKRTPALEALAEVLKALFEIDAVPIVPPPPSLYGGLAVAISEEGLSERRMVGWGEPPSDLLAIGWQYREGDGVDQSFAKAAQYFEKAAAAGLPQAKYDLAIMHLYGLVVPADPARARSLLAEAAAGKYAPALRHLGILEAAEGKRDRGLQWLEQAAELNDVEAAFLAGVMANARRQEGEEMWARALKWLERAERGGQAAAGPLAAEAWSAAPAGVTARFPAEQRPAHSISISFDGAVVAGSPFSGARLNAYVARFGVVVGELTAGTALSIVDDRSLYDGAAIKATSGNNLLAQTGVNAPVSYTLRFTRPATDVRFSRARLIAGPSGISHPAWKATALDAAGKVLESITEDYILSVASVPARTFRFEAADVAAVRFESDGRGSAAFSSVMIDDLRFEIRP